MKLHWNVNQYGSPAQMATDCARVKMVTPGAEIRLDAVNDYLSLKNAPSNDDLVIPNASVGVTKNITSASLPSPFVITFRGPMENPRIVNHSLGADSAHRPVMVVAVGLSSVNDHVIIDTKTRTVTHNGTPVDLAFGSTWFDLAAGVNLIGVERDSGAAAATCSLAHTNPAVRIDWSDLDRRVNTVRDAGCFPMFMVPYWVPGENKVQVDNAAVMLQHAYFCKQLGIHYATTKVKGVEFGNEPNLFYVQPGGALPTVQAKVANICVPQLPAAWPKCSPGMAPGLTNLDIGTMSARDYLEAYWPLAGHNFDFCAIHPYGRMSDIDQPTSTLGEMPGIYNDVTRKPFWVTEYNGASTGGDVSNAQWVQETLPWLNNLKGVDKKTMVAQTFFFAMSDPRTESLSFPLGVYTGAGHARPVLQTIKNWLKNKNG